MARIWLEAEAFDTLGGWVVDQQSMETMGSAYLMAHGMGRPVADAQTTFSAPAPGRYAVWARTRDWTAVWKRGRSAGRFQILIDNILLPEVLGTHGPEWSWQKAGTVELNAGAAHVALRDLTGFNGRCDAIYFTTDLDEVPDDGAEAVAQMRRDIGGVICEDHPEEFDLVVAGGGVAGICAAVAALRSGLTVALLQNRPVLGGCNSSEIRVSMGGVTHVGRYPQLGNVVREISPVFGGNGTYSIDTYEDHRKRNVFLLHPADRYYLGLNEHVVATETDHCDATRIAAVVTRHTRTGAEKRYRARLFADCTGDAAVARMMGAETMVGREARDRFGESLAPEQADRQVMGMSVQWYSRPAQQPVPFPDIDWGIEFNEDNAYFVRCGNWEWETGQYRDQAREAEYIRDYGLMVTYANWSFLKNRSRRKEEWAADELTWVSPLGGKRESCRVVGDHILTQRDIEDGVIYEDGAAPITWNIDLHFPDPENTAKFAEPFRSFAYHRGVPEPYPIPYRCLYARDVANLFLAGRHVSLSHVAFASARVMRVLGMLGEVVGMAAAVCTEFNIQPRDVYATHLDKLKQRMAAGVPAVPYHTGGGNYNAELYHFKDLGHVRLFPFRDDAKLADPKIANRIEQLHVEHKKP